MSESELSILRQAIGLMTTIKPTMEMRADDPIGMAQEVAEYVEQIKRSRDGWKRDAKIYAKNADYWRERCGERQP